MSTSATKCTTHCYHSTGVAQMVSPPRYGETCCHCGDTRYVASKLYVDDSHGPYVPPTYTLSMSKPVTVSVSQPAILDATGPTLGDPLLDVFFGKTTHVLPLAPAVIADVPERKPELAQSRCKQEAKAGGARVLPRECYICGRQNSCPAGKP